MHFPDETVSICAKAAGHKPVLLEETVRILNPSDAKTYLDCTFGGGGHTRALLEAANCKVVAIDRDPEAIQRAEELRRDYPGRFEFHSLKFSQLDKIQTTGYAGVLFDFGVSSFQLDEAGRGFSFSKEAPLDMRMDTREGTSAFEFVNCASEADLAEILREYGEERFAGRIAAAIVRARRDAPIETTSRLSEIVSAAVPKVRAAKIHPATKTFQALRIRVNDELSEISQALPKAFAALESGGVLAAISFHSLEDRIVKRFFKKMSGRPESRFDKSFLQDRTELAAILTGKPVVASESEITANPRSRSAKLRAIRKK